MTGKFNLTKVGVTNVKKPLNVRRPDRVVTLTAKLDVFVDLPRNEESSHLSRNLEAVNEVVDESVRNPVSSIEEMAAMIAKDLLVRHGYASNSEVSISADYFLEKTSPKGRRSLESYRLMSRATAHKKRKGVDVRRAIGVEVVGMTACPCAMETIKGMDRMPNACRDPKVPSITHNQRNVTTLVIDSPEGHEIEADDLIDIVEGSVSSPTREVLKRDDEAELTMRAHENPKFVEDVVRDILGRVLEKYENLPDDVCITVRSESEESIHKHNALAERITTLGELRE